MAVSSQGVIRSTSRLVLRGVFGVGGSNGAISGLTKFSRYVGENNARWVITLVTIYPRSPAQCTLLGCHSNVSFITPLSDTLAMSDSDIFGPLRADAFLESCYCAAVKCTRRLISGNLSVNFRRRLDESLRNCRCRYDAGCKTYRCIIFYIHLLPIQVVDL